MIEDSHLPFFITEELYVLDDQTSVYEKAKEEAAPELVEKKEETPSPIKTDQVAKAEEVSQVNEPTAAIAKKVQGIPTLPEPTPIVDNVPLAIWTPPLMKEDELLLQNILKAINQDFSKAKLMSGISAYAPNYEKLICFGYQKELELKIGKPIPLYVGTKVGDQVILVSSAPETLHSDKSQKMQLWEALQKMFPKS